MQPDLKDKLEAFPLFAAHAQQWEPELASVCIKRFAKDEIVAHHGDSAAMLWLVVSGWVSLQRVTPDGKEISVGLCTQGDLFGEAGLFPHANYPYNAIIIHNDTELALIPAERMRALVQHHPQIAQFVMQDLGGRIAHAQLKLEHMSSLSAPQRLGCFLLRLCQNHKQGTQLLSIPVEKHIVASYLGMKPETLSRSFQHLMQTGVRVKGAEVEVGDVQALREFVCGSCGESGMCETEEQLTTGTV